MNTNIEHFYPICAEQLMETNGGGFAYDVGRILRFIGISAGSSYGTAMAMVDWEITNALNDSQNG